MQSVEGDGNVAHRRRQDAARRAARQIRVKIVPVRHAAAIFVDQFAHGDTGGGEMDAGMLDAARHRERAQTFAPVASLTSEPIRALFQNVAPPVAWFPVVLERRPAEPPDLRDVPWPN